MGLLSILKKMKQKEKDVRILMLYPPITICTIAVTQPYSYNYEVQNMSLYQQNMGW